MHVIAGKFKGRKLRTVKDLSVRPATARVKASIFNVLQSRVAWPQTDVLDLYAGSGSLGIEALSRGARSAVFVEQDHDAVVFLRQNLASIGVERGAEIWVGDALMYLAGHRQPYGVVFVDPPYAKAELAALPTRVFQSGVVAADGYVILEHPRNIVFTRSPLWIPVVTKTYGRTAVTYFQPTKEPLQ